jgi:hypothetical protein
VLDGGDEIPLRATTGPKSAQKASIPPRKSESGACKVLSKLYQGGPVPARFSRVDANSESTRHTASPPASGSSLDCELPPRHSARKGHRDPSRKNEEQKKITGPNKGIKTSIKIATIGKQASSVQAKKRLSLAHSVPDEADKNQGSDLVQYREKNWKSLESILSAEGVDEGKNTTESDVLESPVVPPRLYLLDSDFVAKLKTNSCATEGERKIETQSNRQRRKPRTHRPRSTLVDSSHGNQGRGVRHTCPVKNKDESRTQLGHNHDSRTTYANRGVSAHHDIDIITPAVSDARPHYQPLVSHTIDKDSENDEYAEVKHDRGAQHVNQSRTSRLGTGREQNVKHSGAITVSCYSEPRSSHLEGEQEYMEVKSTTIEERLRKIKCAETLVSDNKGGGCNTQLKSKLENFLVKKMQQEGPSVPHKESKVRYI